MSKNKKFIKLIFSNVVLAGILSSLLLTSCHHTSEKIEPKLDYAVQDKYLLSLPSPFAPLSREELSESWSKEYLIGVAFAHQLDLYQAITAFRRAEILLPKENSQRNQEIQYEIFLCYYLGRKYSDAIYVYENTCLNQISVSFPAASDLLLLLYDCYSRTGDEIKASRILNYIEQNFPEAADKLYVYSNLLEANFPKLEEIGKVPSYEYIEDLVSSYEKERKSIATARRLNALCPGAGYFYLGQAQSGVTAFILNGLFIAASAYFFEKGNLPAGIIFTSFEAGWYFGGIVGAAEEAKFYNERLYENMATKVMNDNGLFPGFMIKYAF